MTVKTDTKYLRHTLRDDKFHTYAGLIIDIRQHLMIENPDNLDANALSKVGTSSILKKAIELLHDELFGDEQ